MNFIPLLAFADQPRENVDLVDRSICNSHLSGVGSVNSLSAVCALQDHGLAELAAADQVSDLVVTAVITAHEANLYKVLAGSHLCINDLFAVCSSGGEGLLCEHGLACLDGGKDGVLVEVAGCCNNDCIYIGISDECVSVCIDLYAADQIGSCLCACLEDITNCVLFR